MPYSEYLEWQEFYSNEPFIADRLEVQLATTNLILSSTAGGKSKFEDFIISNKRPSKPKSKEVQLETLTKQVKGLFG